MLAAGGSVAGDSGGEILRVGSSNVFARGGSRDRAGSLSQRSLRPASLGKATAIAGNVTMAAKTRAIKKSCMEPFSAN